MTDVDLLRRGSVADAIRQHRLIAVLRRLENRQHLLDVVDELAGAGVRVFEVTFDSAQPADDLAAVRAVLDHRDDGPYITGAGTLLRHEQVAAARAVGADFGVAPVLDERLAAAALAAGLPFIPGALTPTEILAAWEVGATFVKLFPASAVGPALVRELRGPLPHIELIPTGGVDAGNARVFLDAGAAAVGVGGALLRADATARRALVAAVGR